MDDEKAIDATRQWLEQWVLKLNLCPFAHQPYQRGAVRFLCAQAEDELALLDELQLEIVVLNEQPEWQTSLMIVPKMLTDFDAFNQFLDPAEALLAELGVEDEYQLASFHPAYVFAGADADDKQNLTNRSPFPMLHLLRQQSVTDALSRYPDPDAEADKIVARNIAAMRAL